MTQRRYTGTVYHSEMKIAVRLTVARGHRGRGSDGTGAMNFKLEALEAAARPGGGPDDSVTRISSSLA